MSGKPPAQSSWLDLRNPAAWVTVVAMLVVAGLARYFADLYHYNVVDDAYISYQYAKNWVLGNGLVFNVGERVEGYTNFLWIVVLAPVYAITSLFDWDFTRAAIFLNAAIAVVDLGLLYAVCRRLLGPGWVPTALVIALCALDNAYQGYAMSGLENHLVILLLLGAVLVWITKPRRTPLWIGLLLALATMARPDGGLYAVAFGLAMALGTALPARFREEQTRWQYARAAGIALAVFGAVYGAYFLWRYSYYGALLPNTFYLKVGGTFDAIPRGIQYANGFMVDRYYVPLIALFALRWVTSPVVRWLFLYLLLHVAYVIYVGGDFYSGHRFLVVLLPIFYLLIGRVAKGVLDTVSSWRMWARMTRVPILAISCIAVSAGAVAGGLERFTVRGLARGPYRSEIVNWSETVDNTVRYMRWLRDFAPPGSSMVVGDIGSAGFIADLYVIDALGIIDPTIARKQVRNFGKGKPGHEKHGSRGYLLSRNPTFIKWGWVHGDLYGVGFYLFTEFPESLKVHGLWVRDQRDKRGYLNDTRIRFDRAEMRRWTATGHAFKQVPTAGSPRGQQRVQGQLGTYINSFAPRQGDRATGRLLSPPFELRGEILQLRVGGGRDPERLRVSLLVDGRRMFSATGHNFEILGRREWDIAPLRGKTAQLEIVDLATGEWGHLLVDEVVQWQEPDR